MAGLASSIGFQHRDGRAVFRHWLPASRWLSWVAAFLPASGWQAGFWHWFPACDGRAGFQHWLPASGRPSWLAWLASRDGGAGWHWLAARIARLASGIGFQRRDGRPSFGIGFQHQDGRAVFRRGFQHRDGRLASAMATSISVGRLACSVAYSIGMAELASGIGFQHRDGRAGLQHWLPASGWPSWLPASGWPSWLPASGWHALGVSHAPERRSYASPGCRAEDCPSEEMCERCQRHGHSSTFCCSKPTKKPREEEPEPEDLPEGFASEMLSKIATMPWGQPTVSKRPKLNPGIAGTHMKFVVIKPKKDASSTRGGEASSSKDPSQCVKAVAKEDTREVQDATVVGIGGEPVEDTGDSNGEGALFGGLVDYGSDSDCSDH
ncbi:hypothetical protein CYMTET_32663 [Cymbomonas tetramitiformis]|uniref:Uncharacterized protein n=1 Tax=Cymbomonas tetramitiformis TaxID=36881 RepID=A0AAE0FF63_9CHLO|nr:hypothetical protein CYMTET_32663 [Cymbomonas tetramitiformis]